jgi:aminopeptidase N
MASGQWDAQTKRYSLKLAQCLPGISGHEAGPAVRPLHIPIAIGLLGPDGRDLIAGHRPDLCGGKQLDVRR